MRGGDRPGQRERPGGFRNERAGRATETSDRVPEPALTDDITASELDAEVRRDLRGLQRDTAESVARHLVAAGRLVDEEPERALEHARFARARASRIAVVREAAGIVAYHAGEWAEALGELRAARRMGGGPGHLAVMADIERALGRPERALELSRGPEVRELGKAESIELAIVAAGARRDLGELDASVVSLQIPELDPARRDPWSARLFYAYADNLLAAGREADALQWFVHAADADEDGETDADRRIAELTGEPLPEDEFAFGVEEDLPDGADAADAPADDASADSEISARADSEGSRVDDPRADAAAGAGTDGEGATSGTAAGEDAAAGAADGGGGGTTSVDTADEDTADEETADADLSAEVAAGDAVDVAGPGPSEAEAAAARGAETGVSAGGAGATSDEADAAEPAAASTADVGDTGRDGAEADADDVSGGVTSGAGGAAASGLESGADTEAAAVTGTGGGAASAGTAGEGVATAAGNGGAPGGTAAAGLGEDPATAGEPRGDAGEGDDTAERGR